MAVKRACSACILIQPGCHTHGPGGGQSGAAVNCGRIGARVGIYRSSGPADERRTATGCWRRNKYEGASSSSAWAALDDHREGEKKGAWVCSDDGDVSAAGSSGNIAGAAAWVGCVLWLDGAHRDRSGSVFVGASIRCSFLLVKGEIRKKKAGSPPRKTAAAGTQCDALSGCGWWRLRGEGEDYARSAHILLFFFKIDAVTFSASCCSEY